MLKMLALFIISFYVLPVQTYAQANKTKHATSNKTPTPPTPLVEPQQAHAPASQPNGQEHVPNDVWVIKAPDKDGWDKAAFGINVILAIVGGIGVLVALKTLGHIETQAKEMRLQRGVLEQQATHMDAQTKILEDSVGVAKMSADIALDNIDLIVNQQRAWIYAAKTPRMPRFIALALEEPLKDVVNFTRPSSSINTDALQIAIVNEGATKALDVQATCQANVRLREGGDMLAKDYHVTAFGILKPDEKRVCPVAFTPELPENVRTLILKDEAILRFFGEISYTDTVQRRTRTTSFNFEWTMYGDWVDQMLGSDTKYARWERLPEGNQMT